MPPDLPAWQEQEPPPSFLLAEEAAFWALTRKAQDLVALDLRGRSDICDFFLIGTGQADVQTRAIARALQEGLGAHGHELLHAEGLQEGRWVLLDYVDVIVHVQQPAARQYYLLERLWGDAPRLEFPEDYFDQPAVRQRHPALPFGPPAAGQQPGTP